ncbi:hypothetical protein NW754_010653 [Fusarium falciforme]|nr:hypothetical protein NW754_010653 [Fusarium falciforme]
MTVQQATLESAALAVFAAAKKILGDEAIPSKAVIVGGAALWHLTRYRPTADIDIWLTGPMKPRTLKRAIPTVDPAFRLNMEAIHGVTYQCPSSRTVVPVDFVNIKSTPFVPRSAIISKLGDNELPWADRDDIVALKA